MWEIVSLTGGFVMLILGAGYLVDNASALASKLGIPNLVIGLTIVAFGTSAPELVVSIISSMKGNSEITIGNIAGSNIFNILVILGISALISPLRVKSTTTWFEVPLCVFSALLALYPRIFRSGRQLRLQIDQQNRWLYSSYDIHGFHFL